MEEPVIDGPDWDWLRSTLDEFVAKMRPVTTHEGFGSGPACGEDEAVRQVEIIRPILRQMVPGWRRLPTRSGFYQYHSEYDGARALRARIDVQDEVREKLATFDASPSISAAGMHPLVWEAAKSQWGLGNHAEAVSAVARAVNASLQNRLGRKDISEGDLIKQAFSDKAPELGKPRLRFPDVGDDQTQGSMRQGVMQFGAGCFAAIRNPLAHLPDDQVDVDEQQALESVAAFSLFARWVDQATLITADDADTGGDVVAEKP